MELTCHIENNHQGGYHTCISCGKVFAVSGSLEKNIKAIHETQRNYNCGFCGKSFAIPRNLKRHIKTLHEGQRNYKCDSCGKYFAQLGNLETHKDNS